MTPDERRAFRRQLRENFRGNGPAVSPNRLGPRDQPVQQQPNYRGP